MQNRFWKSSLQLGLIVLASAGLVIGVELLGYPICSVAAQGYTELTPEEQKLEADRLFQQGFQQYQVSQFREAIVSWEAALQLYRAIGDRQDVSFLLNNLGLVYESLWDYRTAIDYHEQSLSIKREINDQQGEANSLESLGLAYESLGDYQTAIGYYEQSLAINRELDDQQREATSLRGLGNAYRSLGEYRTAINHHEQSLAIAHEINDRQGEAASLVGLGNVYVSLSEYQTAIDYLRQALSIAREINDQQGEMACLGGTGNVYYSLGEYRTAIDYFQQSLAIAREIGDRQAEAKFLGNLGLAHDYLGNYPAAIAFHEQSLTIAREINDQQWEGASLGNLGILYKNLGDYPAAIAYHEQSLTIARDIGDQYGEAASLNNLGLVYARLGENQTAIDYHEQSLTIARRISDRQSEATSLGNLGLISHRLGRYQTAIDYYEQSLTIARDIGDRQGEAASLGNLGLACKSLGDYPCAISYYQQALDIARKIDNRQGESNILNNLGLAYLNTEQYANAENVLRSAIEILEVLRASELPDANKVSLFETQRSSYMLLQQVLVVQNKTNPALEIAERSRARALVELLSDRISERTAEEITIDLPYLTEIQRIAQQQNATLVSYSIINFQDEDPILYIWVIQHTGDISFHSVDLSLLDRSLNELITLSRSTIGIRGRNNPGDRGLGLTISLADQQQSLKTLYDILIDPIAHRLPTDPEERIIFIPQNDLFLVPFAALMDENNQYLIENHTLSIAPSIQTLALTQQLQNPNVSLTDNPLIIGNPTMPALWNPSTNLEEQLPSLSGAENEARAIAQQLNTEALLRDNASETVVAQQMQNASLIHLATHGLLDYGTPEETGIRDVPGAIALAPDSTNDGLLISAEIFAMQLQANLVVLSACDTGRGTITGDGVIGLSRSLMQAGVPSVVTSLWSVPDDSTEFLMKEFYTNLNEMDKAQALRQAMLTTMQQPDYATPLNWAAFTLIGEPD